MKNKKGIATIYIIIFVILLVVFVGYAWWNNYQNKVKTPTPVVINPPANTTINPTNIKITSTTYPNKVLTPGNLLTMDETFLCNPRTIDYYTINTSDDIKQQIFKKYNIAYPPTKQYQIDRYIPIKLGGSNDIRNLWPQSIDYPGYVEKDKAEDYLYKLMCNKKINITTAQQRIKTDWVKIYQECCQ
jgi:hypothetical protein